MGVDGFHRIQFVCSIYLQLMKNIAFPTTASLWNVYTIMNAQTLHWVYLILSEYLRSIRMHLRPSRGPSGEPILGDSLQWRHDVRDGASNHQPHDCLLNRLFRRRSNETSKLCVTDLCAGNSTVTGEVPAQRASNAENVSIWWRHHIEFAILSFWLFMHRENIFKYLWEINVIKAMQMHIDSCKLIKFLCWPGHSFEDGSMNDYDFIIVHILWFKTWIKHDK